MEQNEIKFTLVDTKKACIRISRVGRKGRLLFRGRYGYVLGKRMAKL